MVKWVLRTEFAFDLRLMFLMISLMKWHSALLVLILSGCNLPAQEISCMNTAFDEKVRRTISFSVPLMSVEELKANTQNVRIFDAREREEYDVSRIPGAAYIGYKKFDPQTLTNLSKDTPIVVYCSIGYRSEKIAEKLRAKGFTRVYNLYGSIFEWVNRGYPVVDASGKEVKKVHTYNREWSRWVAESKVQKIW